MSAALDNPQSRSLALLDPELACPACGGSLCLERLTASCTEAASPANRTVAPVTRVVVVSYGEVDGAMGRSYRRLAERRDGVALRFSCAACSLVRELVFAAGENRTAIAWHDVARVWPAPASRME